MVLDRGRGEGGGENVERKGGRKEGKKKERKERKKERRRGEERKGKERKGKERKGKKRKRFYPSSNNRKSTSTMKTSGVCSIILPFQPS